MLRPYLGAPFGDPLPHLGGGRDAFAARLGGGAEAEQRRQEVGSTGVHLTQPVPGRNVPRSLVNGSDW